MIPILAALAEQGLGMLANAVLAKGKDVVEEKLGVKIPDDPKALTPELVAQLQSKQMEHEEFLMNVALEEKKVDYAEMANARDREVKLNESDKASQLSKNITSILALVIVVGGLLILSFHGDTEVRIVVGNLMMLVLGYYFGTSMGSTKAQQTLRDVVSRK